MRFWLSVCFFCVFTTICFAKPRVILATTTWAPYVQNNPVYKGYVYNIVQAAFKERGYDVVIKFMPWDNAVQALKAGKVDGIFPKYFSALDRQEMLFSDAFTGGPIALYRRSGKPFQLPVADSANHLAKLFSALSQYKFGVVSGYHNLPAFDHSSKIEKITVSNDKNNLEQLYAGKVDFIVIDHFTAVDILKNQLGKKFEKALAFVPPALAYQKLHLAVGKKISNSSLLIDDFNRGLKAISDNGKLNEILDKDAYFSGHFLA